MSDRARCEACGIPLPPAAARCPTCGHQQGDVVTVEVGTTRVRSRRRDGLLLVAITVLLVGALAFAGRSDRDPGAAEEEAEPPTTTTTTTEKRRPRTTTSTTTTTLPAMLLGQPTGGLEILVSRSDGTYVVNLDTGASTKVDGVNEPYLIVPTDTGFFAAGGAGPARFFAAPYEADPLRIGGESYRSAMASATPGRIWQITLSEEPSVTEYDSDGTLTNGPLPLPGSHYGFAAVDTGIVLGLHGGIYVMDVEDESLRRIADGDLLTAHGATVVSLDCDELGACFLQLTDVRTRVSHPIEVPGVDFRDGWYSASISPDETMLALSGNGPTGADPLTSVVDLASGDVRPIEASATQLYCCGQAVSWSRDSRWMFWSNGTAVFALERGTDEPIEFMPGRAPFNFVAPLG